ncbi:hypothetical protein T09_15066 [Trichinella sp. T9]|nr:hypothetical protein T09_15066 [Trichinella sp. T9]
MKRHITTCPFRVRTPSGNNRLGAMQEHQAR